MGGGEGVKFGEEVRDSVGDDLIVGLVTPGHAEEDHWRIVSMSDWEVPYSCGVGDWALTRKVAIARIQSKGVASFFRTPLRDRGRERLQAHGVVVQARQSVNRLHALIQLRCELGQQSEIVRIGAGVEELSEAIRRVGVELEGEVAEVGDAHGVFELGLDRSVLVESRRVDHRCGVH